MPVQVDNQTGYPTREVAQLVRFACRELDVTSPNLLVRVKNSTWGVKGRYYCHARLHSSYVYDRAWGQYKEIRVDAGTASHLITIGLPPASHFPRGATYYSRKEMPPPSTWETWQEALVHVAAHEAMHHFQWLKKPARARGRRRWQFVESECDFAGYRILKRWRARKK